jgi:hypothetical protein
MRNKLSNARHCLGQRGATERVAKILDAYLRRT